MCAQPTLRESLSGLGSMMLIRRCATLQVVDPTDANAAAVDAPCRRAGRIVQLTAEIRDLDKHLTAVIATCAPDLLTRAGLGPDTTAAVLITVGDNRDCLGSDASFAALCGASPIEASSGTTRRHRLNRGGDCQANAALHRIVITRIRCDPRTRDYIDRRTSEGKTRCEAIRCLKRYGRPRDLQLAPTEHQPNSPTGRHSSLTRHKT